MTQSYHLSEENNSMIVKDDIEVLVNGLDKAIQSRNNELDIVVMMASI